MEENQKRSRGRPKFVPTQAMRTHVAIMAACGLPQEIMITKIINPETKRPIDIKTLEKAFRQELDRGMEEANALVSQALFKKAVGNGSQSVSAAIFWLKCRARWKPIDGVELTGKDGDPLPTGQSTITPKEFEEIARKLISEV
jgi:hypothetical protein